MSTVVAAPTAVLTTAPTAAPSAASPAQSGLVVWMSDEFLQGQALSGAQVLTAAVSSFQAAYPGTRVSILVKKGSGKGGIEDLLVSMQAALPQALPDVIAINLHDLPAYVKDGVLQPYDAQFSPSLQGDLYPFARLAGQSDGRQYAIPFTADVLQMAYDSTIVKTPPLNWTELYSSNVRYAFAAGSDNGAASDSFIAQYAALGGHFSDARGKPVLDRIPLRDALEFYRTAAAQSIAITNTLSLHNADDAWHLFTGGRATLADVSARSYLRDRSQFKNAAYAAIPTRDGNLVTVSRSWGFALTAADSTRRAAAQHLVESLVSADSNAAWNRAAGRVPVRRSALAAWTSDIAYRDFINQLLSVAINHPTAASGSNLDAVLSAALVDVLANNLSPGDAADKAIAALAH